MRKFEFIKIIKFDQIVDSFRLNHIWKKKWVKNITLDITVNKDGIDDFLFSHKNK